VLRPEGFDNAAHLFRGKQARFDGGVGHVGLLVVETDDAGSNREPTQQQHDSAPTVICIGLKTAVSYDTREL
jgi:hypothetical protein